MEGLVANTLHNKLEWGQNWAIPFILNRGVFDNFKYSHLDLTSGLHTPYGNASFDLSF